MKKIIYFLLLIILILTIITFPKKDNNKISVSEVTHSVFYTPFYIALENGYFSDEGLDIELILTPGADKVSAAVLSGDSKIGLAGAESAMYIFENEDDYLQIFSGLTKRDGQFIVSRNKDFKLEDLYGKEILVGRSSGMPALSFLNALENENIDKDKININYSIDFASLSGAFIGGEGDFVNLFEPTATLLEKENIGHVVKSVGLMLGEMPYTVFYARKSFIENNPKVINSFRKAINKALIFVKENDAKTISEVIHNQFIETDIEDLEKLVLRYKENDSWQDSFKIPEYSYENIKNILIKNNLIKKDISYDKIILN